MRAAAGRWGTPLVVPVLIVVVWWVASARSTSVFYPPLREILETFRETWVFAHVGSDVVPTLRRLSIGYGLAVFLGIGIGILLGRVRVVDRAVQPLLQFARAIPAVALIPPAIVVLGIGDQSKIVLIAFGCVFPILLNTIDGVRNVEPGLEDVGEMFQLTRRQRILSVQLPSALPQIFAGMRTTLGLAFILGIVTEMTGSTNGVGFVTLEAQMSFRMPQMWAGMLLLGILGCSLNALFLSLERRILRWHYRSKAGV